MDRPLRETVLAKAGSVFQKVRAIHLIEGNLGQDFRNVCVVTRWLARVFALRCRRFLVSDVLLNGIRQPEPGRVGCIDVDPDRDSLEFDPLANLLLDRIGHRLASPPLRLVAFFPPDVPNPGISRNLQPLSFIKDHFGAD
jgi:hypothetical protein